ncbi:hypothetical protein D1007_00434 [Hordeum vulgare]|nr:hypothetical protein D1007_00434 [Hordeum vulgare]
MWPSASDGKIKNPSPSPSPLTPAPTSVPTLADHLTNDATDSANAVSVAPPSLQSLSRQRSCTEVPRFADTEERKIGRSFGKSAGHAFGHSMRFLPTSKPAAVMLTPSRVAPSDLRRLAAGYSLDAPVARTSRGHHRRRRRPALPMPSPLPRRSSYRTSPHTSSRRACIAGHRLPLLYGLA